MEGKAYRVKVKAFECTVIADSPNDWENIYDGIVSHIYRTDMDVEVDEDYYKDEE